jgi:ribosome-associated translation inhibitor RaiA
MQIGVSGQAIRLDQPMRQRIEHRLRFILGRFAPRIQSVAVRLCDLNGPKGGTDKRCLLRLKLAGEGSVHVVGTDAGVYAAVARAAERAFWLLARSVERRRDLARGATRQWTAGGVG